MIIDVMNNLLVKYLYFTIQFFYLLLKKIDLLLLNFILIVLDSFNY